MRRGHRTYQSRGKIDYKRLRKINAEAAREGVLEYLKMNNHNISEAAYIFGINRTVVYDITKKEMEGNLRDRPKAPEHQPRKTPKAIEDRIIEAKNRTRLGQERLSRYLKQHEGISIPAGTTRHIIKFLLGCQRYPNCTALEHSRMLPCVILTLLLDNTFSKATIPPSGTLIMRTPEDISKES